MEKSKLIEILKTFDNNEIKRFKDFICSPYFNTSTAVQKLYNILKPYHPEYPPEKITKEKIFGKLYPGKPYNEQVMKNLTSEFIRLSKEFLGQQFYQNGDGIAKSLNIIRHLNSKRLDVLYNKERKNLLSRIYDEIGVDKQLFENLFNLAVEEKSYLISRDKPGEVDQLNCLQGRYKLFSFFVNVFTTIHEMEINANVFNTKYEVDPAGEFIKKNIEAGILDDILGYINTHSVEHSQVIHIYYYIMKAYTYHENEEYYDTVNRLVLDNLHIFSRTEKHLITNSLLNICINKLKRGSQEAYRKALDIFKIQLKHNIHKISDDEIMTVFKFRNIFFIGLQLKEYAWLETFLNTYINELAADLQENIYNNLFAYLCFYKKQYEKALEHISKVKFDRVILKVDVKNLTLLIYYELGHYESALSMIDSYRHFLSSVKDLSDLHKEGCSYFINSLNQLIKLKTKFSEHDFVKLKTKVLEKQALSGREWFLEKLGEIEEKNLSKVI
jgi:hypothetical protein